MEYYKKKQKIYILTLIFTLNISYIYNSYSQEIKKIKSQKYYKFDVNNNDTNKFGYQSYDDDQDVGAKGIAFKHPYVYVCDTYHKNVKRINILSGKMTSSKLLGENALLSQIACIGNNILVLSDWDTIYILDTNMIPIKKIKTQKTSKYLSIVNDTIVEAILMEGVQKLDLSIDLEYLRINNKGRIERSVRNVPLKNNTEAKKTISINGFSYDFWDGDNVLQIESNSFELKRKIPKQKYGAFNFTATKNCVVFFDSEPEYLSLYYYFY